MQNLNSFQIGLEISIIFQCLFSIVYLLSFRWRRNKWLVIAFFSIGWTIFNLEGSEYRFGFLVHPAFNNPGFGLLTFPCIYFYTANLVGLKTISSLQNFWHFIPPILLYILFIFCKLPSPEHFSSHEEISPQLLVFLVASVIIPLIYTYLVFKLVKLNQQKYQNEFAESNLFITLDWIKWTIALSTLFITISFLGLSFDFLPAHWFILTSFLLACATLSFFSFRQPTLYNNTAPELVELTPQNPARDNKTKYRNIISPDEKEKLIKALEIHLKEDKPYLNPSIRMPELASSLDVSTNVFSYLINEHFKMNFFSFINRQRVDYSIELLKSQTHQHYTLETISEMSGFKSKSNFYRRFKEIMGKSPGEYQREIIKE